MVIGITIVTVVVLMAIKEIAGASDSEIAHRVASFLTAPIMGLLMLFVITVAIKIIEISA